MFLYVLYATSLVAEALRWNIAAQSLDELHGPAGDVLGKGYHVNALQDEIVRLHGIWSTERWPTSEKQPLFGEFKKIKRWCQLRTFR